MADLSLAAVGGMLLAGGLAALWEQNKDMVEPFVSLPLTATTVHDIHLPATEHFPAKTVPLSKACFLPSQAALCNCRGVCSCPADACPATIASVAVPSRRRKAKRQRAATIAKKYARVSAAAGGAGVSVAREPDTALQAIDELFGFKLDPATAEARLPAPDTGMLGMNIGAQRCIRKRVPVQDADDPRAECPKAFRQAECSAPTLPLSDMRALACVASELNPHDRVHLDEALAQGIEPVVYDRLTVAPVRSRLRAQADPIRGDLPIAPAPPQITDPGSLIMYRPSVTPHIDLRRGYFSSGDFGNACALESLMASSSGRPVVV